MAQDMMRYDVMVEEALRSVVHRALSEVAESGLPGNHHFYITFRTDYPGVEIPQYLHERYQEEMTIVLQFQYYDMEVKDEILGVTLNFNNIPERLVVPLAAITIFADPSVNFALQFQQNEEEDPSDPSPEKPDRDKKDEIKLGEVVSLDQFRRK